MGDEQGYPVINGAVFIIIDRMRWYSETFALATVKRAEEAEERSKALETALREVDGMLDAFPAGVDEDANPDDQTPEDAESHTAGLIRQVIRTALEQSK